MTTPQPGWYADPAVPSALRWWDGGRWTDAVLQDEVLTRSPLPGRGGPSDGGARADRGACASSTGPVPVVDQGAAGGRPAGRAAVLAAALTRVAALSPLAGGRG